MDQKENEHEPVAPLGVTLRGPFWFRPLAEDFIENQDIVGAWFGVTSKDGSIEVLVRGEPNADFVETALNQLHEDGFV